MFRFSSFRTSVNRYRFKVYTEEDGKAVIQSSTSRKTEKESLRDWASVSDWIARRSAAYDDLAAKVETLELAKGNALASAKDIKALKHQAEQEADRAKAQRDGYKRERDDALRTLNNERGLRETAETVLADAKERHQSVAAAQEEVIGRQNDLIAKLENTPVRRLRRLWPW